MAPHLIINVSRHHPQVWLIIMELSAHHL